MKIRVKNLPMIIVFILILGLISRFYPLTFFSTRPAGFSSYVAFSDNIVTQKGHLVSGADIEVYDQFSGQLGAATQTHPILVLPPIISILMGIETTSWLYNILLSVTFSIPFLLSLLLLVQKGNETKPFDYFVVGMYALLATPNLILTMTYGGATLGYLVIVNIIYLYNRENRENSPAIRGLMILFAALIAISYFVGAVMLLVMLGSITIFEIFSRKKITNSATTTLVLLAIMLLTYLMYVSTSRFGNVIEFCKIILLIIQGKGKLTTAAGIEFIIRPYITSTSLENSFRTAFNALFVMIPPFYFLTLGYKQFRVQKERFVAFSLTYAIIPTSLMLSLIIGGVGRVVEYGALVSLILFALMAGRIKRTHWKFLQIIAVIAILSSTYAYSVDENKSILHITYSEQYATDFLSLNIDKQNTVFTDYRLAAPILSQGHFRTTGIALTKYTSIKQDIDNLKDVYWGNDSEAAYTALTKIRLDGRNIDYLLISKSMTQRLPSIRTYTFNLKPAPEDFYIKYDIDSRFSKVYSNDKVFIYKISQKLIGDIIWICH